MVVQRVVFDADACKEKELFYRSTGNIHTSGNRVYMEAKSEISLNTYFNLLDISFWEKFAGIKKWKISFHARGSGDIYCISNNVICSEMVVAACKNICYSMEIKTSDCESFVYLKMKAATYLEVSEIEFEPCDIVPTHDINISAIICTYKRNVNVLYNLEILKNTYFFNTDSELYGKLNIHIVDNASELQIQKEKNIHLYHNKNTGGSGGFARGMDECVKREKSYKTSHVLLMDDDVEFVPESFYRLYALLCYILPENIGRPVAGRMFRADNRKIQYTAAEIWNRGNLLHVGFMKDMSKPESLLKVNNSEAAEYGGWWFCCYPMEFVRENRPLPFFLHCDDVEYGLRCGKTPIILNGIQVWHETYEYRQSPVIAYYDYRNSLYVNQILDCIEKPSSLLKGWKYDISQYHIQKNYEMEYIVIRAFYDYQKGLNWLKKGKNSLKNIGTIIPKKMINPVFWRIAYIKFCLKNGC